MTRRGKFEASDLMAGAGGKDVHVEPEATNVPKVEELAIDIEDKLITLMTVEVGQKEKDPFRRKDTFLRKYKENGRYTTTSIAQGMMVQREFEVGTPERLQLVRISVRDLGFPNGARLPDILGRAQRLGLKLVPPDAAARLAHAFKKDKIMSIVLKMGMEPIPDVSGTLSIFVVTHRPQPAITLDGWNATPSIHWPSTDLFVFQR